MSLFAKNSELGTTIGYFFLATVCMLLIPLYSYGDTKNGGESDVIDTAIQKRQLKTIIVDNYYPYTFVNQNGEPDGFSVDLIKAVTQEMGLELNIDVNTWDLARNALKDGNIDVLPMMAYSKERDQVFDFSVPHTIAYDAFFTKKDASKIRSLDDLRGKKIIVMKGDQAHDYLLSAGLIGPEQLILIDSLPDALKLLSSGKGDAALMPKLVGLIVAKNLKLKNLELSPIVIEAYNRPFSFAVTEGNLLVLERLSQGLNIVKESNQYSKIYEKWFGALEPPGLSLRMVLKYVGGIIIVFILIGSVLLLWSFSLRRQVALRTRSLGEEIGERKQAEESVRKSEQKYRSLVESTEDSIYLVDRNSTYLFMNEKHLSRLGLQPDEFLGRTYGEFHSEDDTQEFAAILEKVFETGRPIHQQHRSIKDNKYFLRTLSPVRESDGRTRAITVVSKDITERVRSEETLRESEEKYRELSDSLPQIVFETDEKGNLTFTNRMAFDILGYTREDFEKGLNALQMLIPEDHDRALKNIQRVLKGEKLGGTEYTALTKDGRRYPAMVYSTPIISEEKSVGMRGIVADLTEVKQAQKALLESEERLRIAGKAAYDLIYEWDVASDALEWFGDVDGLLGYRKGEISRDINAWLDLINPEDKVKLENAVELHRTSTEPIQYEYRVRHKDGTYRHWNDHGLPLLDDKGCPYKWVGVCTDITDRKKAEEALRESEDKFRSFAEQSIVGIYLISDGVFKYVNPKFAEIFGYSVDECLDNMHFPQLVHPEDLATVEKQVGRRVSGEIKAVRYSFRGIKKSGETIHVEIFGSSMVLKGKIVATGTMLDITDRKQAEEKRKQLQAQLQQAQKMEAMGTLAGGIAHDFNNLLMAIQGRTSIMRMSKDSSHPDFEHLKEVEGHIKSAADLTRQLLGFARGGKYEVRPTDLNELIEKQNRMFGRTKKEITIHGKYEEDLWPVEIDRGQIEQVLLNLYVNAWQAMPGGGSLYLKTENVTLDKNYVKPFSIESGRYVKISVTDTGAGMDKATQRKIFDPFFTTKEMGRGTGLGLASSYGIIKNHGGLINVYSEKDHGATFNIYLPASEKKVSEEKKPSGDLLKGSETVLFVDDEDMIIEVAEELFKRLGYKVLIARGGKEAVEIYEKNKGQIDMVILDMIMPDMSGSMTYDRMKEIDPDIKVLLASGYSIDGQATEILDRGCNAFIQKPFKVKELSQKLREVLDDK